MPARGIREFTAVPSAASTVTTEAFSTALDVNAFAELVTLVQVTAASGASPTLTVRLQTWSEDLGQWFTHSTIVSALDVTNATTTAIRNAYTSTNIGRRIRISHQLGGTVTSVTYAIVLVIKD